MRTHKLLQNKGTPTLVYLAKYSRDAVSLKAHLAALVEMGDHNDDGDILLPDHPPEEVRAVAHGALRGNEGTRPSEPVHVVGIQVFLLLLHKYITRIVVSKLANRWQ